MADTPPASSGGEGELEFGREILHGRSLHFVSGPDAKRWYPMMNILQNFFLGPGESRSVLQRRMNDLDIERVPATKEQVDVLHRAGMHTMSTRIKLVKREDVLKLLASKLQPGSSPSRTPRSVVDARTKSEPEIDVDGSVADDPSKSPESNARMRRVMAMLKSDLVGRDVNCIQPSWRSDYNSAQPTSDGQTSDLQSGERHRAAGHVTGTTRTRVVKRPRRHDGFISLDGGADSSSDSDGPEGRIRQKPARKKKNLGRSRTLSCSAVDNQSDGDVMDDLGIQALDRDDSQSMKVILRREYSPSEKRSTWVNCSESSSKDSQLPVPPTDVVAQAPRQPAPKQAQLFAARKTVSSQQRSAGPLRKGKGFSLARAIPCPPVLLVRENNLVPACSCAVNIAEQGLPPLCHPLWSWSVGQSVNKDYLIKTTDVAWRNRSVVVRRRQQ